MSQAELAKRLTFPAAFPDVPKYLVWCHFSRALALEILGPPVMTARVDGLGNADMWEFEYSCGLQAVLEFLHYMDGGIVLADSPEVQHLIRHLPFPKELLIPIDDVTLKKELGVLLQAYPTRQLEIESLKSFQVWRQDDHGNSFKVGEPTSERDAKCWVADFESHGHKQIYWYSRV